MLGIKIKNFSSPTLKFSNDGDPVVKKINEINDVKEW
jgi:hypothetical protein